MSTCHARWYSPGACGAGDGRSPTENSPRSWWLSEPPARRNMARPPAGHLDGLEAEGVSVERGADLGVAHPQHGVVEAGHAHDSSLASMSSSIFTLSPTSTPPVSSGAFHSMPKSLRLIVVVALKPALVLPHGSCADAADLEVERDRLGDAADRQVAVELELVAVGLDARRAGTSSWGGLDVEEVVRPQVVVAGRRRWCRPRPSPRWRRHVDCRRVVGGDDARGEVGEPPADLGDHHVADDEADVAVAGIDCSRCRRGWGR